jgi:glycosyltransferase involved in cell wall biosynthesis
MTTPKISIVIPFFNQAKFVEECISSALGQTYNNIEVILVNDGSNEDIDHIIDKFLAHPNFKYIKQENKGTSGARNTGIRSSTGDYILPLDSDDVLPSTTIQSLVDNIVDENTILVLKARLVGINLEPSDIYYPPPGIHFRGLAALSYGCSLTNSSLYSRKLFDLAGGYDEGIKTVEDWEFWIRCVAAGAQVKELPNTLHYLYRQHPNSISNSKRSDIQIYDAIVKERYKHFRGEK